MRHSKYSLTLATGICICICTCAILLSASCSQDTALPGACGTDKPAGGTAALHITSASLQASQEQPGTRAAAADLLTSGSIGVFRSQGTGYTESQDNRQYTYNTAAGAWQPQSADQTVYLMANDAVVCAYYPYNNAYANKTAIPLASGKYQGVADDPAQHDPADLCYAAGRTMNGTNPSTGFGMSHAMAMVQVRLRRSDFGTTPRRLTSISVSNAALASNATLDITSGICTAAGKAPLAWIPGTTEPSTGIDLPAGGTSEATSALLVPCASDVAGTTFSFTVDRKSMSVTVPVSKVPAFEAGKIHKLVFDIRGNTVTLESVSITGWKEEWLPGAEPGIDSGATGNYIELGGEKWALANLAHDAASHTYNFALTNAAEGAKLQWNALTGTDSGNATAVWDATADPCARLEPKGTWVTPTKEQFAALAALPNVGDTGYKGVNGRWFGTADAAQAALHSGSYLFLPAAGASEVLYWTQSYNTATASPVAYSISPGNVPGEADTARSTACQVRCLRKP